MPKRPMPLTAHLKFADSPVTKFLADRFPNHRAVVREVVDAVHGADTIRPAAAGPRWSTLGHAIEYRLLYGIGYRPNYRIPGDTPMEFPGLVRAAAFACEVAAYKAGTSDTKAERETWTRVLTRGIELSDALTAMPMCPVGIEDGQSDLLTRLLYVQSHFEDMWRSGGLLDPSLTDSDDLEDLASRVPAYAVDDIRSMSALAAPTWRAWTVLAGEKKVFNPVFPSRLGVPADADVVIDGTLIDVKATVNPLRMSKTEIYQLAGYLLMDVRDRYGMTGCGLYLARQGVLVSWSLERFFSLLTGRHLSSEDAEKWLVALRGEFEEHLSSI